MKEYILHWFIRTDIKQQIKKLIIISNIKMFLKLKLIYGFLIWHVAHPGESIKDL